MTSRSALTTKREALSRVIFGCSFFLLTTAAVGQDLRGRIRDQQKAPIDGAYIYHSSGKHAHSNSLGRFTLSQIEKGDTLSITYTGYEPVRYIVGDPDDNVTIQLKEKILSLDEVTVSPDLNAINLFTDINLQTNPVNSSQELLRRVPGLIIGQHAGGGKAEQIFLRGFDVDHGTDVNITMDGMPVNMVSHAHGQGYADLHFIIPETVNKLDFGKGPYYANQGNFATAGYVSFKSKDRLDQSQVRLEMGQFNTQRFLGMFNVLNTEKHSAYLASEYLLTDGPFESPQNFDRFNIMGKYSGQLDNNDQLSISFSHFTSKWDASGQIPQRAVDNGSISRFGAIDDTEGGQTSRSNLLLNYTHQVNDAAYITNTVYYTQYDFELFSNFTFYLDDPVYGDQIRQFEDRQLFGASSEYNQSFNAGSMDGLIQAGAGFRSDQSKDNELSHTANRKTPLDTIQLGNIYETNMFGYINAEFKKGKWSFNPSIRFDQFKFNYVDRLASAYETQEENKGIISPKLNVLYNQSETLQLYLKAGKGFHSNDTRVVVAENGKEILPAAYGADIGFIWKPFPKLLMNTAYWYLFLEQEFVYVGDAGIVEPSGKTRREGIDLSLRYEPIKGLFWDFDMNYTLARAMDEPEGNDYIPLAPDFTITSGLSFVGNSGFYGGAHLRFVDDRPANEDNSIVAEGYTVVDMNAGYQWRTLDFSINIQNVFDTEWNETQFATESRLIDEPAPVEEIHFTPGTPFYFKASVAYRF
ncbi:TonB-dependent receptor [Echinicola strongylocentroti]|uniref:TonB-dependent receptor n=1 Tax=Echinicola strongylocentroti TaxID=1795355 RepID=A0A2Z4IN93_9BACT|nr:TonB-dependent receptor [Echinicola strongylocentroti]AWW32209.1 TonB-dependent receptor [Echinicola strongylocentroti]